MVVLSLIGVISVSAMAAGPIVAPKKIGTLTVATDATWPPMEMVDTNKNIVGFDIDFMKALAKEAGVEVMFKNTAWDGIFGGLDAGKYDAIISSVTITDERKKQYDFSLPYINIGQILVVLKSTKNLKTLSELKGKKVGAQIGTTGAFEVKKISGVELKSYDEIGLAFEDLASGRVEGVVCDEPTATNYALRRADYKEKFQIVGEPFTIESYGIVVKKGDQGRLDLLNKGIRNIKSKGIDELLKKKWLK
jgi:polar amino acid transport system substrate-binding protein